MVPLTFIFVPGFVGASGASRPQVNPRFKFRPQKVGVSDTLLPKHPRLASTFGIYQNASCLIKETPAGHRNTPFNRSSQRHHSAHRHTVAWQHTTVAHDHRSLTEALTHFLIYSLIPSQKPRTNRSFRQSRLDNAFIMHTRHFGRRKGSLTKRGM